MKNTFYFLITITFLTLLGLAGYYFGFLGFIYNVMMPKAFGNFPLIILSIIFGVAAFFSPCSSTVLPAFVSHYITGGTKEKTREPEPQQVKTITKGIYFGFIAALGILTVNVVLGLIIAFLGSAAPFAKDPRQDIPIILGVRIVAGLIIAYLGLLTIMGKPFEIPFVQNFVGKTHSASSGQDFRKSIFLYGLLYNGAAIGCTGPILLGLMLYALTSGSFQAAFVAFLVFALTMGVLMVVLTTLIAMFKGTVIRKIVPLTPTVQKIAGYVMIFVGISIALLTFEGNRLFVKLFFPFLK